VFLQFIKCSDEAKESEAVTEQETNVATEGANSAKVDTTKMGLNRLRQRKLLSLDSM